MKSDLLAYYRQNPGRLPYDLKLCSFTGTALLVTALLAILLPSAINSQANRSLAETASHGLGPGIAVFISVLCATTSAYTQSNFNSLKMIRSLLLDGDQIPKQGGLPVWLTFQMLGMVAGGFSGTGFALMIVRIS